MKTKIINRLKEHWNAVVDYGIPEERIIGVFLYGSQNYGFATEKSDIDSKVIILPSIEDICFNKQWISTTMVMKNGENVDIKDIRAMRENWLKQNLNFIETLFTEYKIINPKYEELFNEYFINNREEIANIDKNKGVKSMVGQMEHTLNSAVVSDKKLHNAERICYFLEKWLMNAPYETCLKPTGEAAGYMKLLKLGLHDLTDEKKIQKVKDYITQGQLFMRLAEQFTFNEEAAALLDKGVVEILKFSFKEPEIPAIPKEEFFSHLTNLEYKAYESIIDEIGANGTVVVSKLVKERMISRPVYNNLLEKLKLYNVAEVNNMGVKGTSIKIIHPELKILAKRPH